MLFNSPEFILFFTVITGLYFLTVHRYRWILLLSGSYYFYMCWNAEYIILIFASTVIDYFAALRMGATSSVRKKKLFLTISLVSNLSLLFVFKYYNFISGSLESLAGSQGYSSPLPQIDLLLPVGISFYTFQTLSYTIDVYRGRMKPEKHFGIFALYVSFFPQLVAGPIERATSLIPQLHTKIEFDYARVRDGLSLMLWGFFKKIVIADRLAILVDAVYGQPSEYSGLTLLLASFFFAFQIYCDFSGYSDIAIGSAKILGFSLMKNFDSPYLARSITDFWKRWHISLSTWFRDYLYIPLGGNRVGKWRWYYNLMIVFLISGLWHGANWTFIAWGALHGTYLVVGLMTYGLRRRMTQYLGLQRHTFIHAFLQITTTFTLVQFAWIFFRAHSVSEAFSIIQKIGESIGSITWMVAGGDFSPLMQSVQEVLSIMPWYDFGLSLALIAFLYATHMIGKNIVDFVMSEDNSSLYRWTLYYAASLSIILFGKFNVNEFIYFQF